MIKGHKLESYFFLCSLLLTSLSSESRSSPFILYMIKRVAPTYHAMNNIPYMKWVALRLLGCILIYSYSYIFALERTCSGVGLGPPSESFRLIMVWPLKFLLEKFSFGGLMSESSKRPNTFFNESVILFILIKFL